MKKKWQEADCGCFKIQRFNGLRYMYESIEKCDRFSSQRINMSSSKKWELKWVPPPPEISWMIAQGRNLKFTLYITLFV